MPLGLEARRRGSPASASASRELRARVRVLHHERRAAGRAPGSRRSTRRRPRCRSRPPRAARRRPRTAVSGRMRPFATAFSATPPARQRFFEPGAPVRRADEVEVRLLEHRLQRGGDVLVVPRSARCAARAPGRTPPPSGSRRGGRSSASARPTSCRRLPCGARSSRGRARSSRRRACTSSRIARQVALGVAVRREAHHLALVAVLREAEPLRDRRVEDPERVRERARGRAPRAGCRGRARASSRRSRRSRRA